MNKLKLSSKLSRASINPSPLGRGRGGVTSAQAEVNTHDTELQSLIDLSGLHEKYVARQNGITPEYLSMLKTGTRKAITKRVAVKVWLVNFISHNLKLAA